MRRIEHVPGMTPLAVLGIDGDGCPQDPDLLFEPLEALFEVRRRAGDVRQLRPVIADGGVVALDALRHRPDIAIDMIFELAPGGSGVGAPVLAQVRNERPYEEAEEGPEHTALGAGLGQT